MADDEINWRNLPPRLIPHIFKHLARFDDYLRAHFACKKWSLTLPLSQSVLRPQPPLLMLPSLPDNAAARPFVDIPARRALLIPFWLPHPDTHCCSTSHGWLFFLCHSPSLFLFNPVTYQAVRLPSLDTLPSTLLRYQPKINAEYVVRSDYPAEEEVELPRKGLIRFAVLSADPAADPEFEALLLLHRVHKLVFRYQNRPGAAAGSNRSWTPVAIDIPDPPFLVRDIIYAREPRHIVFAVGASNKSLLVLSFPGGGSNAYASVIETPDLPDSTDLYLALTPKDGTPMLVTRHERLDAIATGIRHFRVFLLQGGARESLVTVKEAVDMAEFAVFVGPSSSVCIDTAIFPEYKANGVYFIHEYYKTAAGYRLVGETVGRYDLQLRWVDETCDLDALGPPISLLFRSLGPAMWFTPSLRTAEAPPPSKPQQIECPKEEQRGITCIDSSV